MALDYALAFKDWKSGSCVEETEDGFTSFSRPGYFFQVNMLSLENKPDIALLYRAPPKDHLFFLTALLPHKNYEDLLSYKQIETELSQVVIMIGSKSPNIWPENIIGRQINCQYVFSSDWSAETLKECSDRIFEKLNEHGIAKHDPTGENARLISLLESGGFQLISTTPSYPTFIHAEYDITFTTWLGQEKPYLQYDTHVEKIPMRDDLRGKKTVKVINYQFNDLLISDNLSRPFHHHSYMNDLDERRDNRLRGSFTIEYSAQSALDAANEIIKHLNNNYGLLSRR